MKIDKTEITLIINGAARTLWVGQNESLLDALRNASYVSVKSGCHDGAWGVCTVLVNGVPTRSCKLKVVALNGAKIGTLEGIGDADNLHPLQEAYIETGAIQCGYCTPAQILSSKALLDKNSDPSEDEVRAALDGVLCRCTGYVRGVDAVRRAASVLRGEKVDPYNHIALTLPEDTTKIELPEAYYRKNGGRHPLPPLVFTPVHMKKTKVVGESEVKVDAKKLALGRPVFTDDVRPEGMLYGALLTSPHAHARIRDIHAEKARALPGVHAVLTYKDIPRIKYASGGQSFPQPLPYDQVCLDDKVRHVGDRVAVVAAETLEIANQALKLIEVEYEVLPAVVDEAGHRVVQSVRRAGPRQDEPRQQPEPAQAGRARRSADRLLGAGDARGPAAGSAGQRLLPRRHRHLHERSARNPGGTAPPVRTSAGLGRVLELRAVGRDVRLRRGSDSRARSARRSAR